MTIQNLGLFQALGAKMDYLNQRQRLIAQNIANADTPNYRPMDLAPMDFGALVKNISSEKGPSVRLDTSDARHLSASGQEAGEASEKKQKKTYEVAPVGNAVVMEEQLMKSGQTIVDYNLITGLYQKNMTLLKIAIGANR